MPKLFSVTTVLVVVIIALGIERIQFYPQKQTLRWHQARLKQSELLWRKSLEGRRTIIEAFNDSSKYSDFPNDYFYPYNPFDLLYPSFSCPTEMERVGRPGDGGKWICGMSILEEQAENGHKKNPPCVVYSFGIKDDSSLEAEFLNRTECEIWGYDYSVESWGAPLNSSSTPEAWLKRAHFEKAGISGVSNSSRDPPFYSFLELMKRNGHSFVDVVKMDIEGAEFEVLTSTLASYSNEGMPLPIGQLLVEVHLIPEDLFPDMVEQLHLPRSLAEWVGFWELLEAKGMRVVSSEPNAVGIMGVGRGQPRFAELTLLNTRLA